MLYYVTLGGGVAHSSGLLHLSVVGRHLLPVGAVVVGVGLLVVFVVIVGRLLGVTSGLST